MEEEAVFAKKLLTWHKKNALKFPWRETKDPYKILLAEILLRKTTRGQVKELFEELIKRYPNSEKIGFRRR
jgi:A/G-specific adenine glycosylase